MVTKRITKKRATVGALRWKPEWVVDPGPDLRKALNRGALRELNLAKREFTARVKDILKRGQQK